MTNKVRMRVYVPDWNTNFMDQLPTVQRPAEEGETVRQVVVIPHVATKIKKAGVK